MEPEGPTDPAHVQILQPSVDQKNELQIATLLSVQAECRQLLAHRDEIGSTFHVDPDAHEAALRTYELASLQLRNILDAQDRWSAAADRSTQKMEALLDLKLSEAKKRLELSDLLRRPSVAFRAKLKRLVLGERNVKWCCWLGGDMPTVTDLHEFGDTADEAAKNFDRAFHEQRAMPPTEPPPAAAPEKQQPASRRAPKKK